MCLSSTCLFPFLFRFPCHGADDGGCTWTVRPIGIAPSYSLQFQGTSTYTYFPERALVWHQPFHIQLQRCAVFHFVHISSICFRGCRQTAQENAESLAVALQEGLATCVSACVKLCVSLSLWQAVFVLCLLCRQCCLLGCCSAEAIMNHDSVVKLNNLHYVCFSF